jgi:hypothetical protein
LLRLIIAKAAVAAALSATISVGGGAGHVHRHVPRHVTPVEYAQEVLHANGTQLRCVINLWNRESGWNARADNPYSGAYGIPQALPGWKMASAGRDWRTDARTQIRWGAGYIRGAYGNPCNALLHEIRWGWY